MTASSSGPLREVSAAPLPAHVTVAIVGAGPAGLGVARVLRDLAIADVKILERREIGASFRRWPAGMHFITPSFPSNAFGLVDLNAINFDSSPAYALKREHLSGAEYAAYLEEAAEAYGLDVATGVEIAGIEPVGRDMLLHTNRGDLRARFVIWAAGQFQYPNLTLPGSEHGIHASQIRLWSEFPGDEAIVVGGYESGIDAAIGLATAGKMVTVLARKATWDIDAVDPGIALSPLTAQRLSFAIQQRQPIHLIGDADIVRLDRDGAKVKLIAAGGRHWTTASFPVLATGFTGGTSLINAWFEKDGDGDPLLTEQDESTVLSGLFLVGPEVCHQGQRLSFIYKFRQRFAAVGCAIAERLGMDTRPLDAYRARNMFLDESDAGDREAICREG